MGFDLGGGLSSKIGAASATFSSLQGVGAVAKNIGAAGSALASGDLAGAIRAANLPAAGELIGNIAAAVSLFDSDDASDWRVRLSIPSWPAFSQSAALKPLKDAGGLVFPYTPQINMQSTAKYSAVSPTHSNFEFQAYENSASGSIQIIAPFNVEDSEQALYWIAAVHYLRSATKMFTGRDPIAGNPPPIVYLNGYGNYVFKNVPVVISQFSCNLDAGSDYIPTEVKGSAMGAATSAADAIGGVADQFGLSTISKYASAAGDVTSFLGGLGLGGSVSGGQTYVPTKSSITVTLLPAYSRATAKNFSLQQFVQGGYMSGKPGFI